MNTFDQTNFQTVSRTGPFRRVLNGVGLVILVVLGAVISPELDVVERIRARHAATPITESSMGTETPSSTGASTGASTDSSMAAEPPRDADRPSAASSTTAQEPIESDWDQPRRIAWGEILRRIEHGLGWLNRLWTRTMLA